MKEASHETKKWSELGKKSLDSWGKRFRKDTKTNTYTKLKQFQFRLSKLISFMVQI